MERGSHAINNTFFQKKKLLLLTDVFFNVKKTVVSAINSLVSDCLFAEVVGFVKLYLTFTGRKSEKNSDFTQVFFCSVSVDTKPWLGGETSNIFYFHPDPWGDDPI